LRRHADANLAMMLSSLRLFQFRNFANQEITMRPGLCFFVGRNGQGKTNLLESVFMLSRGESFRPAQHDHFLRNSDPDQFSSERARVVGGFQTPLGKQTLTLDFSEGRRSINLDGKRTGFSTTSALFPVVLFSPESLAAIKEGPDQRRQLIDSVLTTRSERDSKLLREFTKTLRARNILLKQISGGDARVTTRDSLESLTTVFLLLATQVTEARLNVLRELAPEMRRSASRIFGGAPRLPLINSADGFASEELNVRFAYEISGSDALDWSANQIFDALSQRRTELERREIEYGASLVGPQKHDLRVMFNDNDSRFYCSQGQQRALILAFKIAQINVHHSTLGRYPILLLDDVMSELDADKRSRLMEYLEQTNAQVLITATDLTWSQKFSHERNAVFTVENGSVTLAASSAVRAVGVSNMLEDAAT
jgi:DNA replication and repair protein RecF